MALPYVTIPFVKPAYVPDTHALSDLLRVSSQAKQNALLNQGQIHGQGYLALGALISNALGQIRESNDKKAERDAQIAFNQQKFAQDEADKQRAYGLQVAQFQDLAEQRAQAQAAVQAAAAEKAQTGEKAGDERAKAIGYGPVGEQDVNTLMNSPARAGDVRYSFGPGTAEGPELQPTQDQQTMIQARDTVKHMGGTMLPDGKVIMPPVKTMKVEPALVAGKRAFVRVDPQGNMFDMSGQPVQADPIPPVSATAANAPMIPDMNGYRPDPKTGDKFDPTISSTPNALYQNALAVALQAKYPPMGMGSSPAVQLKRNAIDAKAAAMAAAAGADIPTLRAEYAAHSKTLSTLMPKFVATATAANTASDNLDLAMSLSDQVGRTNVPLVNRYSQWLSKNLTPATGLSQLEEAIYTASREYAKTASGSAASSQGLTDSASHAVDKLLSAAQAPETFKAVASTMKADMGNITSEQTKSLAKESPVIANFLSIVHGGGPVDAATPVAPVMPKAAVPSGVGENPFRKKTP